MVFQRHGVDDFKAFGSALVGPLVEVHEQGHGDAGESEVALKEGDGIEELGESLAQDLLDFVSVEVVVDKGCG